MGVSVPGTGARRASKGALARAAGSGGCFRPGRRHCIMPARGHGCNPLPSRGAAMGGTAEPRELWYSGISRYQWLVLVLASLGWVFDIYEGQIFVASMGEVNATLLPGGTDGEKAFIANVMLAAFLVGGAL